MSRRHICDVPGCGASRLRWQRLCTECWDRLPHWLRVAIRDHHRHRRTAEHRAACKKAREHLDSRIGGAVQPAGTRPPVTSEQAYANAERLLGEH